VLRHGTARHAPAASTLAARGGALSQRAQSPRMDRILGMRRPQGSHPEALLRSCASERGDDCCFSPALELLLRLQHGPPFHQFHGQPWTVADGRWHTGIFPSPSSALGRREALAATPTAAHAATPFLFKHAPVSYIVRPLLVAVVVVASSSPPIIIIASSVASGSGSASTGTNSQPIDHKSRQYCYR
jgi:hypothetical protein